MLTPSGAHCANVLDLVEYGRPLVVEKPLALRLADADRMIEACDAHGVKLFVVHQNRYNLPIVKAREALEQGRFGELVLGTGPAAVDSGPGLLRLGGVARHMGPRRRRLHESGRASHRHAQLVHGERGDRAQHGRDAAREDRGEDTGVAVIRYNSGALGVLGGDDRHAPQGSRGFDQHPGRERQRGHRRLFHE